MNFFHELIYLHPLPPPWLFSGNGDSKKKPEKEDAKKQKDTDEDEEDMNDDQENIEEDLEDDEED